MEPPKIVDDRDYVTAMAHFYRGELGRIMVWRQRLDTTTNWAVVTATAIITYALGHRHEVDHVIFMIANIIVFLMLIIEGRRYRYYDAFRARVRMLEAHFLAPVVTRRSEFLEGDWRHLLAEDLLIPSFKIGIRESTSRRLRRNYIWIFGVLLLSWLLRIYQDGCDIHKFDGMNFFTFFGEFSFFAQNTQPFPPWFFWGSLIFFYSIVIWLGFYAQKDRYASGEMERSAPSRAKWKI